MKDRTYLYTVMYMHGSKIKDMEIEAESREHAREIFWERIDDMQAFTESGAMSEQTNAAKRPSGLRACADGIVRPLPAVGDYVLATKYGDGDPQDHWCVGFYAGLTNPEKYDPPRYDVVDGDGRNFRGNGFRRIKKITPERGAWMLKHAKDIELSGRSVWYFARCSMDSLPNV